MNRKEIDGTEQPNEGQRILAELEGSLNQFHAFHSETLRVHAAYLRDQLEVTGSLLALAGSRFSQGSHSFRQNPPQTRLSNNPVRLKSLPDPDSLEIKFPEGHIYLLTDDGTPTTTHTAAALQARGWPVVVLGFPLAAVADRAPLPGGVSRVNLKSFDEDHLRKQLTTIAESAGPIGTFTYLHPPFQLPADRFPCFSEAEKDLIKQVFLLAKHLKEPLETAAQIGRSSFLTVVRLDGHLGLGETGNFSPLSGGLSGLTKSLNLEWPSVFCRAIDLDPKHDPEQSACDLLSEFNDPDLQIVEVGIGPAGRSTLVAQDPD